MKRCGACKRQYRGAGSVAHVGPQMRACRVCPTCSSKATKILAGETPQCGKCGEALSQCSRCEAPDVVKDKLLKVGFDAVLKTLLMRLALKKKLLRPAPTGFSSSGPGSHSVVDGYIAEAEGYIEGLEMAIETIKSAGRL